MDPDPRAVGATCLGRDRYTSGRDRRSRCSAECRKGYARNLTIKTTCPFVGGFLPKPPSSSLQLQKPNPKTFKNDIAASLLTSPEVSLRGSTVVIILPRLNGRTDHAHPLQEDRHAGGLPVPMEQWRLASLPGSMMPCPTCATSRWSRPPDRHDLTACETMTGGRGCHDHPIQRGISRIMSYRIPVYSSRVGNEPDRAVGVPVELFAGRFA